MWIVPVMTEIFAINQDKILILTVTIWNVSCTDYRIFRML